MFVKKNQPVITPLSLHTFLRVMLPGMSRYKEARMLCVALLPLKLARVVIRTLKSWFIPDIMELVQVRLSSRG